MVGAEAGLAAADRDLHPVRPGDQRGHPYRGLPFWRHHDRPAEGHPLQSRHLATATHRGRHLGHGLHAEHGRDQQVAVEVMVVEVQVGVRRQRGLGDQLHTREMHQRPLHEPQQRQLGPLELQRVQTSGAARHDDHRWGAGVGDQLLQCRHPLVRSHRGDPVPQHRFHDRQPFPHADP